MRTEACMLRARDAQLHAEIGYAHGHASGEILDEQVNIARIEEHVSLMRHLASTEQLIASLER